MWGICMPIFRPPASLVWEENEVTDEARAELVRIENKIGDLRRIAFGLDQHRYPI